MVRDYYVTTVVRLIDWTWKRMVKVNGLKNYGLWCIKTENGCYINGEGRGLSRQLRRFSLSILIKILRVFFAVFTSFHWIKLNIKRHSDTNTQTRAKVETTNFIFKAKKNIKLNPAFSCLSFSFYLYKVYDYWLT